MCCSGLESQACVPSLAYSPFVLLRALRGYYVRWLGSGLPGAVPFLVGEAV